MSASEIGKKLFPDYQETDDRNSLFHYHKGRVCRIKSNKTLSGSSYSPQKLLSAHDKASGIVNSKAECFVKVDKASSGIKTGKHLHDAAKYIARNSDIDLENEDGVILKKSDLKLEINEWITDQAIPDSDADLAKQEGKEGKRRPADARRLIISCPKGTDPEAFKKAVREFAEETLKSKGYRYVFGMHCKSEMHPNEPDHPHIHILIKSVSFDKRRLNLRKSDLRQMRERFAVIARQYGIELNATNRAVRAQNYKAKTAERWHQKKKAKEAARSPEERARAEQAKEHIRKRKAAERNSKQSQEQKWAFKRKRDEMKSTTKVHPYEQARENELFQVIRTGQKLNEPEAVKKARKTREKVKENMKAYAKALKQEGDIDLASKLESKADNLKPMKTMQETVLEKVKIKLKAYTMKQKEKERVKDKQNSYEIER
ncbi:MAG: hypothetical protein II929_07890 [Succinivibrio sp.]|nr:hypothetical protein [Succinivibrio sp.]